jgi:hypothetical protein
MGNLFRFSAQGPDFFYHNRISRPKALIFGFLLHRRKYGRFLRYLIQEPGRGDEMTNEVKAFFTGFLTHVFLDRRCHPFIDYFSGWVDRGKPETQRYYRCHAFFERILDVLILKERRDRTMAGTGFSGLTDCGEILPVEIVTALSGALEKTYPTVTQYDRIDERIQNAYRDTRAFYRFTDYENRISRRQSALLDLEEPSRRRLALFHPESLPEDVDFLNVSRRTWLHPCSGEEHTSSFLDLYEAALADAKSAIKRIEQVLNGEADTCIIEELVGNDGLNTGKSPEDRFLYSDPLPLSEILEEAYKSYVDQQHKGCI